jgi:hypothetical protein
MQADRNKLTRMLAELDQVLAESEAIAAENGPESQSARDFIAKFEPTRRRVEELLREE